MVVMGDLEEITELTLGLPGGGGRRERVAVSPPAEVVTGGSNYEKLTSQKRGLSEGVDQVDLLSSNEDRIISTVFESAEATSQPPPSKAQAIGWPPVRSYRKKVFAEISGCKYVKVAADGAPYLRKVDLETYNSYQELLRALKYMFSCINILGDWDQRKVAKFQVKGMAEFVPTYEDKDGDLMLVGDVPWKMFTESCKRIRLMKNSESIGLAPRTTQDI